METVKEFENSLGKTQVLYFKDEDSYAVKLKTDYVNGYEQFKYKSEAIECFQFNCYWLENNA